MDERHEYNWDFFPDTDDLVQSLKQQNMVGSKMIFSTKWIRMGTYSTPLLSFIAARKTTQVTNRLTEG